MDHRDITALMAGIAPVIREHIAESCKTFADRLTALEQRPAPVQGEKGEPGEPAAPLTREQLIAAMLSMPEVFEHVAAEYFEANPVSDGKDGANGVGLAGALIDRDGELVVTLSDGTSHKLGPVIGKDGAPGKDGNDGFSLEDLDVTSPDHGRTLVVSFTRGELVRRFEIKTANQLYQGVWHEGEYRQGDSVSYGGSTWIATADTTTKPETANSDWRLSVKRGRDGKDGKDGKPGAAGPQGVPGRDGRQY